MLNGELRRLGGGDVKFMGGSGERIRLGEWPNKALGGGERSLFPFLTVLGLALTEAAAAAAAAAELDGGIGDFTRLLVVLADGIGDLTRIVVGFEMGIGDLIR